MIYRNGIDGQIYPKSKVGNHKPYGFLFDMPTMLIVLFCGFIVYSLMVLWFFAAN